LSKCLIVGYGNPDREDDGVAWHILQKLALQFGRGDPNTQAYTDTAIASVTDLDFGTLEHRDDVPDLLGELQLMPEIAETIAAYDKVCFVDAHTGAYAQDVNMASIQAEFQTSPFTHHLTPETCLVLAQTAFGHAPSGVVVSVRGYQFGFSNTLSQATAQLADEAVKLIVTWLQQ
jgi:Ni,Fe-hydrogenase maturation factor